MNKSIRAVLCTGVIALSVIPTALAGTGHTTVGLPDLSAPVRLWRDSDGIPHILAFTELDAVRVQGWMHAEDRLFQIDATRRQASGTLAELLGPDVIGDDLQLRLLGLRHAAVETLSALDPETQTALHAYADGVNAWVAANGLPSEYAALELTTFEPWSAIDSIVVAKALAFSLSFDIDVGRTDSLLEYQEAGVSQGFNGSALFFEDLERSAPFDPAATVPDATTRKTAARLKNLRPLSQRVNTDSLDAGIRDLFAEYLGRIRDVPMLARAANRTESPIGSNEWAVSGRHTVSGRPVVANDPHLSLGTPATFYHNHLTAVLDGLDASGASVPGVPWVVLGQNNFIAWGATTNSLDVTDVYQEQVEIDPSSPSFLSTVYQGEFENVLLRPETFRYNQPGDGSVDNIITAEPFTTVNGVDIQPGAFIVPRRNNGPIVALNGPIALSVQYTGFGATREIDTFRSWNFARNLTEFRAGLANFDFGSQNFCYADIFGNIAYFSSAELPIREDLQAGAIAGLPPSFVRNGSGGNEWSAVANPQPGQALNFEILPPEEMPQTINPGQGWFVNANNDPAGNTLDNDPYNELRPGGGIYYLEYSYAIGTRAGRITQALTDQLAQGGVTRAAIGEIQNDVVMLDAQVFTPYLLSAFANAGAVAAPPELAQLAAQTRIIQAIKRLTIWDYTTPTGVVEGYDAADFNGTRGTPTKAEVNASIAATLYSVWRGQMIGNTLDATLGPLGVRSPGSGASLKALRNLLDNFDTNQGVGASGIEFFAVPGIAAAGDRRDFLLLSSLADALDLLAGSDFAAAFGNSTNQNDYHWGRLHRIVMRAALGGDYNIPPAGGSFPPSFGDLPGLATDGGFGVVDASSHSARADSANDFMFGSGPVRRYLGGPAPDGGRITGESSLPGGNSGVLGDANYSNLLGRWLTNDRFPLRRDFAAINSDAMERVLFVPQ